MREVDVRSPPRLPSVLTVPLAIGIHALVSCYHRLRGYTRPGTNPSLNAQQSLEYDIRTVRGWSNVAAEYTDGTFQFDDRDVLELGPGPDIGAGLVMLAEGARSYTAIDITSLLVPCSSAFYPMIMNRIARDYPPERSKRVQDEFNRYRAGRSSCISYVRQPNFDLGALADRRFDLVVSQAAFEHFDNPILTIKQLSRIVRPGALFVAQVDLSTHTPWIRDIDPLSIYRIPNGLYRLFSYPGIPNRVRPDGFKAALTRHGFHSAQILPVTRLSQETLQHSLRSVASRFRGTESAMDLLSVYLAASFRDT